jgi:hypothetical protein
LASIATVGVYGGCSTASSRLQAALASAGIEYRHHKELAPITDRRLFCVERDSEACHRSVVAERLEAEFGTAVVDLRP